MSSSDNAKTVAKKAAEKRQVYVDPEVVARRRAEKAAKKAEQEKLAKEKQADEPVTSPENLGFTPREMIKLPSYIETSKEPSKRSLKIMTWNVSRRSASCWLF